MIKTDPKVFHLFLGFLKIFLLLLDLFDFFVLNISHRFFKRFCLICALFGKNRAYEVVKGGRVRIEAYTAESAGVRDTLSEELLEKREKDKIFEFTFIFDLKKT